MASIHVPSLMRQVQLDVWIFGARRTALRTRLGVYLIKTAAAVIGCEIEIIMGPHLAVAASTEDQALRRVLG